MRLQGCNALITGGSGIVGSGIVRKFLLEGATVIAPVRSDDSKAVLLAELHDVGEAHRLSQLHVLIMGEFASQEGMRRLAGDVLQLVPHLDHIVSSFGGGFKSGPCSSLAPEDVLQVVGDRVTPHLVLAQSLFPLLKDSPGSSFIFITGMLGERCSMPDASALTISNAALYGIIRALEAEHKDKPQRINEVRIAALIRKDNAAGHPFVTGGRAFPASMIGEEAVVLAAGTQRGEIVRVLPADLEQKMGR